MNPRTLFVAGFVTCVGFITFEELRKCHDIPWPPRIVATALVFAMLDMFSVINEELAGVVAIGFVLAIVINTLNPATSEGNMFMANCQHAEATVQTTAYDTLQGPQDIVA